MQGRNLMIVLAAALFVTLSLMASGGGAQGPAPASTTLKPEARQALLEALTGPEGEYAAFALYDAILARHGRCSRMSGSGRRRATTSRRCSAS